MARAYCSGCLAFGYDGCLATSNLNVLFLFSTSTHKGWASFSKLDFYSANLILYDITIPILTHTHQWYGHPSVTLLHKHLET